MTKPNRWIGTVRDLVTEAAASVGTVNVPVIAQDVYALHPQVPLLEIEQAVLAFADVSGAAIVFDRGQKTSLPRSLVIEFVDTDHDEISDDQPGVYALNGSDPSVGNA